jgi:hypothetical protein
MVFNLLEFNNRFKYYWWLVNTRTSWGENGWPRTTTALYRWPASTQREGVEMKDPRDYPDDPPLNRQCSEDNIQQTIVAEYDTMWARGEYLELYFRVYHSITKRIIRKIVRKGLVDSNHEKYDDENIVDTLTSFLPSGLPVDTIGMQQIANRLHERRKKKRISEEAQLQKEKERMELTRCLICRGIELLLQKIESTQPDTAINERRKTEHGKARRVLLSRSHKDEVWANRMNSVKLIYFKIQEF